MPRMGRHSFSTNGFGLERASASPTRLFTADSTLATVYLVNPLEVLSKTFRYSCSTAIAYLLVPWCALGQPFWPQFRGPLGQGLSSSARPPVTFSSSNALWSTDVPPGHSSPVIWGNQIFLTCVEGDKLDCRAYDRTNGKLIWTRPVAVDKLEQTQAYNNAAASTPAVDADSVIFYFGSYGLLAFTHAGEPLWEKKLPVQVSRGHYGAGTSPILCNDLIVLANDTDEGGSCLLAFKRKSGQPAWEAPRPLIGAGWSTPVFWSGAGKPEIVLLGSKKLIAYDPGTGKELWSVPGFPLETSCSPAFEGEHLFACSAAIGGRSGEKIEPDGWKQLVAFDKNKDGKVQFEEVPDNFHLIIRGELPEGHPGRTLPFNTREMIQGMDQDKDGALSESEWNKAMEGFVSMDSPVLMSLVGGLETKEQERIVWKYGRGIPEIPSPLAWHGKVFLIRDGGILQCMDSNKGAVLYQERVGAAGGYAASPVGAQDRIYLASQSGTVTVVDAKSDSLKVLARNPLGEKISATPALAENAIYVRTDKHLFAFTESTAK
jgi:outer membrane protein assembly factor BamB